MRSTTRTTAAVVTVGLAIIFVPAAPTSAAWQVTDLSAAQPQPAGQGHPQGAGPSTRPGAPQTSRQSARPAATSGSHRTTTTRRTARAAASSGSSASSAERDSRPQRVAGHGRHPWWPKGFCQAVRDDRWPVRQGDTLDLVARCTGATVDELRALNGITGTRVRPGQVLVLP